MSYMYHNKWFHDRAGGRYKVWYRRVSKKRNDPINTRAIPKLANDTTHRDGWAKITKQDALLESRETVIFKKPVVRIPAKNLLLSQVGDV